MSKTYLAIQAIGAGKLKEARLPVPEPGPEQVRIRVEACGICHTDAFTIEGGMPGLEYPRVPGHEVVGRIEALGSGVREWTVGQRVGVGFLGGHCGVCKSCRRGDFVNCQRQLMSGAHYDGGYAEVMLAMASGLVAIPDDLSAVEAAPLLCAGLTTFNGLRNSKARAGDLVAIQGVGGLGHLGVQFAHAMGFRVAAIARGAAKAQLATKLGADLYIDATATDPAAELQKLGGATVILATAADSASQSALLGGLAPGGELVIAGAEGTAPLTVNGLTLIFGTRSVVGTLTGTPIDGEDTLAFSALRDIRAMVETYPLAKADEAYHRMLSNQARFRVVLVTGQ